MKGDVNQSKFSDGQFSAKLVIFQLLKNSEMKLEILKKLLNQVSVICRSQLLRKLLDKGKCFQKILHYLSDHQYF